MKITKPISFLILAAILLFASAQEAAAAATDNIATVPLSSSRILKQLNHPLAKETIHKNSQSIAIITKDSSVTSRQPQPQQRRDS